MSKQENVQDSGIEYRHRSTNRSGDEREPMMVVSLAARKKSVDRIAAELPKYTVEDNI